MIAVTVTNRNVNTSKCSRCGKNSNLGDIVHHTRGTRNGFTYYCKKCKEKVTIDV